MERKAIVTIVSGDAYKRNWQRFCLPNWQKYAERHGCELIVLEQPVDTSERARKRSIAWQKLLIGGHPLVAKFDKAVWIDADIVVNHRLAPCVVSSLNSDPIGICEEATLPAEGLFSEMAKANDAFWTMALGRVGLPHPLDPYRRYGFADRPNRYFNCGLIVISPAIHCEFLEHVYYSYEDKGPYLNYEQIPLSYELAKSEQYELIDAKYNVLWLHLLISFGYPHGPRSSSMLSGRLAFLARLLERVYFLHFAGAQHIMRDLDLLDTDRDPVGIRLAPVRAAFTAEIDRLGKP
jgi:hypothetical protein